MAALNAARCARIFHEKASGGTGPNSSSSSLTSAPGSASRPMNSKSGDDRVHAAADGDRLSGLDAPAGLPRAKELMTSVAKQILSH